jgi:alkylhydroperoxidase family enzyme
MTSYVLLIEHPSSSDCAMASNEIEEMIMADIKQARTALLARILDGDGTATPIQRRAAFDDAEVASPVRSLIEKVATHAHEVTDEDVAAARASGLSEDQIFEIVVCAAIGQANRQYDTALRALEAAAVKR